MALLPRAQQAPSRPARAGIGFSVHIKESCCLWPYSSICVFVPMAEESLPSSSRPYKDKDLLLLPVPRYLRTDVADLAVSLKNASVLALVTSIVSLTNCLTHIS